MIHVDAAHHIHIMGFFGGLIPSKQDMTQNTSEPTKKSDGSKANSEPPAVVRRVAWPADSRAVVHRVACPPSVGA